jgi:carbon monoxide dehydrogenase subunit G
MELKNEITLSVDREVAWDALNDPEVLQQCIPGCESLLRLTDDCDSEPRYEMLMVVAVGPVKAKFKGKMTIRNSVPPVSYTIQFEGQGGAAGHGKGDAHVSLDSIEEGKTILRYAAKAAIGGRIAQVGSRLVDIAAKKMATEFVAQFNSLLTLPPDDGTAPAGEEDVADPAPT